MIHAPQHAVYLFDVLLPSFLALLEDGWVILHDRLNSPFEAPFSLALGSLMQILLPCKTFENKFSFLYCLE